MSEEQVQMLRRGYDLIWREGQVERALAALDEDFEWVVPGHPDAELSRGPDEVIAFFRDWMGSWDELEVSYDLRDAGAGQVLGVITMRGTGRGSGARTEMTMAQLWTFEGGRVRRMVAYTDAEEGLAAAGLTPSPRERLLRESAEAYNRVGPEGLMPYLTEDVVWQEDPAWPDGVTSHGHAEVLANLRERLDSMAIALDIEEIVERGDRALVLMHWRARGSGSGVQADLHPGVIYTFRGDLVCRAEFFIDPERARAALDAG
jgi:ketosteroid isomerase-like protein